MDIYVSDEQAEARRVVYRGLMEIAVDSMSDLIHTAEAQSLHAQVAELKVRVDHLMHMRESDRREYIESINKSSESRAKMHEKMDILKGDIDSKFSELNKTVFAMPEEFWNRIKPELERAKNIEVILLRWALGIGAGTIVTGLIVFLIQRVLR